MENITLITGNLLKAEQISKYLHHPIAHMKVDLIEVQSLDLREIVEHKAKEAYKKVGGTVLVEDTSVRFHALGKLPGPLIKWFLTELGNQGLCKLLDGYDDRSATVEVCFGLYDGKELQFFEGTAEGTIASQPRNEQAFGWNPIFISEGSQKTWGELNGDEPEYASMRQIALRKLEEHLRTSL